jgi:long-chain fatty acid transport protein
MTRFILSLSFATTLLVTASTIFAGGLYLPEIGTPISVGTAGVGTVTNNVIADAAVTNPAGMTDIESDVGLAGLQVLIPTVRFDSDIATAGGSDGGNAGFVSAIPATFVVKTLGDDWRLGLGITAPLGGGVDYGKDFVGRYQAQRSVMTGLGITPSVGYKVNDKLSLGGGISFIYSNLDLDIAINQPGSLSDGQVNIDKIDDWGYQGFVSAMYKATDRLTLGAIYRAESDVELEGDIGFKNIQIPFINEVTSKLDKVEVDFSYPQMIRVGLKYELTDTTLLMMDFDWEEWSAFGDTRLAIEGDTSLAVLQKFDRDWDDTWHAGLAMAHKLDTGHIVSWGVAYDSSPVSDSKRTADLPVDEQFRLSASYGGELSDKYDFALGTTFLWLGKGKMDQIAGGERFKGEFSTNNIVFLSATMNYNF